MKKKSLLHRLVARLRGDKVTATLLDVTGSVLSDRKWIFIIGCYNSGTTLLEQILSDHAQVSGLNDEGVMLTNKLPRPEDFGWRRMWWKCEEAMTIKNEASTARTVKRHWSHFYASGKPYLVEKSISNTPRLLFFEKNFKPVYFIHLVRNGYAVAEGIRRKAEVMPGNRAYKEGKQYPLEWCATQWKRSLEVVDEQKDKVDHFMELTYEELTYDPDAALLRICTFLNIDPFPGSLKQSSYYVHQRKEVIKNMNEQSLSKLTPEDINIINDIAAVYLKRHNYYKVVQ